MLTKKRLLQSVDSINDLLDAHDLDLEIIQEIIQDSVDQNESLITMAGPLMIGARQVRAQRKVIIGHTVLTLLKYTEMVNQSSA